jgi:hypothetical protein
MCDETWEEIAFVGEENSQEDLARQMSFMIMSTFDGKR